MLGDNDKSNARIVMGVHVVSAGKVGCTAVNGAFERLRFVQG